MEVDGTLLIILGTAASVLILCGWLEQIIKGYKTKSLKDVSKYLMLFIAAGAILWLLYGLIIEDIFIIGTNLAAIFFMIMVLFMKRRYDKTPKLNQ